MKSDWLQEKLPDVKEIQKRIKMIFPREVDMNGYINREMGAKTIFTFLYCSCVGGEAWIRPATITCMTDEDAVVTDVGKRRQWYLNMQSKDAPRDIAGRWYKPNTREPIRDETIRELVRLGAVVERSGLPTTSPLPRYSLQKEFADLFCPHLEGEELEAEIAKWREEYLSASALARLTLSKRMVAASTDGVLVQFPNQEVRKMVSGPSSELTKAVVEQFTKLYMKVPGVIMVSESANKLLMKDDDICRALGICIDVSKVLPDIMLVDLGYDKPLFIFVECVATDGPVNSRRKEQLIQLVEDSGFDKNDCSFVTAFLDRSDVASRKLLTSVAWGTFVWFASEPKEIVYFREGLEGKPISVWEMQKNY